MPISRSSCLARSSARGSVCRSAAGRSRFLATPQLEQLRPLIVGFQEKEADGKVPEAVPVAMPLGLGG